MLSSGTAVGSPPGMSAPEFSARSRKITTVEQDVVTVEIDDVACRVATDGLPPLVPPVSFRAAIEQAEKDVDPDGSVLRRMQCSTQGARDLRRYFEQAAAELQIRGDYERSTACAQGAERVRRVLEGHPRISRP